MLKSISRSISFLALALIPLSSATAQEDDAKIVASVPTVVATVPIKEVNDQKLANASIEIEGEESKDNVHRRQLLFRGRQGHQSVREGHCAR